MAEDTASAILKVDDFSGLKEGKKSEDFSPQADALIERVMRVREAEGLRSALAFGDEILALEKKCRQAQDGASGSRLCSTYMQLLFRVREAGQGGCAGKTVVFDPQGELLVDPLDPKELVTCDVAREGFTIEFVDGRRIALICQEAAALLKKRGQLKPSVSAVVRVSMQLIPFLQLTEKLELIEGLKAATDGKIFVEVERARLILLSALIKEKAGDIEQAAQILQDVQVETFGAMSREEKTKYILKQMALLVQRGDFIRCQIVSKKLSAKLLEADDLQELKLRFYELMTLYFLHEGDYLETAKCALHSLKTAIVEADPSQWKCFLETSILFLVLAPYDEETKKLFEKTAKEEAKKLQELPVFDAFTTTSRRRLLLELGKPEIISWPLPFEAELKTHVIFTDAKYKGGKERWELLRKRILQHNLRVLGEHYTVIRMQRVASLLAVSEEEAETELCELASAGGIYAKIDRPARTVAFGKSKTDIAVLEEWSCKISKLLDKVDLCCHMIQKERMVHAARSKASSAK